jgi:hypothetical protein
MKLAFSTLSAKLNATSLTSSKIPLPGQLGDKPETAVKEKNTIFTVQHNIE